MKKTLLLAGIAGALSSSAMEFPYSADFSKPVKTDISIMGKTADGILESGTRYHFARVHIPASEKALCVQVTASVKDGAALGVLLFDKDGQKVLLKPMWQKELKDKEVLTIVIPADKLKTPVKLSFYNTARKGSVSISELKINVSADLKKSK